MTTITEFLLARIAEDETVSPFELRDRSNMYRFGSVTLQYGDVRVGRDRWLAECEVKRKIVKGARMAIQHSDTIPDTEENARIHGYATGLEMVLELLVLPYAKHPDYQQEWTA